MSTEWRTACAASMTRPLADKLADLRAVCSLEVRVACDASDAALRCVRICYAYCQLTLLSRLRNIFLQIAACALCILVGAIMLARWQTIPEFMRSQLWRPYTPTPTISTGCWYRFDMVSRYRTLMSLACAAAFMNIAFAASDLVFLTNLYPCP